MPQKADKFLRVMSTIIFMTKYNVLRVYDKNLLKWTKIECHERLTNFFSWCRQSFLWQNIRFYEFTTRICWNEQKLNATKGWKISSRNVDNHLCDKFITFYESTTRICWNKINDEWVSACRKVDVAGMKWMGGGIGRLGKNVWMMTWNIHIHFLWAYSYTDVYILHNYEQIP